MSALELIPKNAPDRLKGEQLANLLGVSPATVMRWAERGDLPPPLRLSRKIIWFDTAAVRAHLKAKIRATPVCRAAVRQAVRAELDAAHRGHDAGPQAPEPGMRPDGAGDAGASEDMPAEGEEELCAAE